MKFSVYYRLSSRDVFFRKFWEKEKHAFSPENSQIIEANLKETMETIVYHIVRENKENLKVLLSRTNAKYARTFYDYIMKSDTKSKSKADILNRIDEDFNKEAKNEND